MSELIGSQKRYYVARAPEYDDWWYRRGRYALGGRVFIIDNGLGDAAHASRKTSRTETYGGGR